MIYDKPTFWYSRYTKLDPTVVLFKLLLVSIQKCIVCESFLVQREPKNKKSIKKATKSIKVSF